MDLDRLFILNMKKWRKKRGISQKTLSERCEASHTYIRQLESGTRTPSFALIGKLAEALDIEASQLFYDETAGQRKNPSQRDRLEAIKADILVQTARELDMFIIEALKEAPN
jgi:transcriptional regulator with XRE-family HTH domain